MEVVIKIDDYLYDSVIEGGSILYPRVNKYIREGIPLPKGHGRLIDADAYLSNEQPAGISETAWKESHTYKSITDTPTILEAR